jgi:glucose-6-phosphate isomerase
MDSSFSSFNSNFFGDLESGFSLDISRMGLPEGYVVEQRSLIERALSEMQQLEAGAIANQDEGRMVGHYWLRSPERAPTTLIRDEIQSTLAAIKQFAASVRRGEVTSAKGNRFTRTHVIGIGGSALGPQFVADSLASPADIMRISFFDNTDPDGIENVLKNPDFRLEETLVLVVSKSGGTKETRNGELIMKQVMESAGIQWASQFVAVTGVGSELDKRAEKEGWLARFPMWDWVGGRTSELSAVGLLPAALQGIEIDELLAGAAHMDSLSRNDTAEKNPALLLALSWLWVGNERGEKDLVILPYKDRLQLLSRYLQQLIMESLGKEFDRDGKRVNQGIAVYGNKGSTDQHAYVQQLRDGLCNFFVTFVEVLENGGNHQREGGTLPLISDIQVEDGVTAGDYLFGFLYGTREALSQQNRPSLVITIPRVNPLSVGMLIALFERAVGFYATFINVNAYHQPGVEAGKKAAEKILLIQKSLEVALNAERGEVALTIPEICRRADMLGQEEMVFQILRRWSANGRGQLIAPNNPAEAAFTWQAA